MSDAAVGPLEWRQRHTDRLEAIQTHLDGRQAQIHTGMPGIIVSFDAKAITAVVQPAIQAIQRMTDGTRQPVSIAQIHDVPVHFPGGGGFTLSFPVKAGDECWISFAERSIDNWHQQGGVQQPSDWRMHDITDAVAHVGVRSQTNLPAGGVSATTTQLRSDDGTVVIELDTNTIKLTAENVTVGESGGKLGVLGTAPIAKATITGSYNGNVALKNLLQFLQSRGDIIDGST
jgi:hypothetical protein